MNEKASVWRWRLARFVALAVIIALCPLPALAGDQGQPPQKTPGIRASAATIVKAQSLEAKPALATQGGEAGATHSPSFFKSPVGIAVLATLAAGVGYAAYSLQHDRIHSVARQGQ